MLSGSTLPASAHQQMLCELCDRNVPGEFTHHPDNGPEVSAKVRFLEVIHDRLLIDFPLVSGRPVRLPEGEVIRVYFVWQEQRFTFMSRVQGRDRFRTGDGPAIPALAIGVLSQIDRAQRRGCYRLSLLHLPLGEIQLRAIDGSERVFDVTVINLSETGCEIMLELESALDLEVDDRLTTRFELPGDPEPFDLTCQTRWLQKSASSGRIKLGMEWDLDVTNRQDQQMVKRLAKFVAHEQQRMLRRQR